MKREDKKNLLHCIILTFILTLLLCWLCPTQGTIPDIHEPCFCDTCCEAHWENIRHANPDLHMSE